MSRMQSIARRGRSALAGLAGLALALGCGTAAAQVTYTSASTTYNFIDSSTHSKIGYNTTPYKFNGGGGCGTTPPVLDDTISDSIPIGFTFKYGVTNYTTAYVMSNGRLQFGNTTCGYGTSSIGPPQVYPYSYPNASMNNTMKVFGVDLDPTNLVDKPNYPSATNKTPCTSIATCYVSVATIGSAPARQFVVTWKNVPEWVSTTNTSGSFDLQIVLNEDGTFVYQYGNNISHGGTGTAQVGWQLTTTDYQVLSFGASIEPSPNTAIKFFLPGPLATYAFEQGAWVSGAAGQVLDSTGTRHGTAIGRAQSNTNGKICRAADIPANTDGATVDAIRTGLNVSDPTLNMQGTGTAAFWYRSRLPWSGAGAQSAQLLDATAVNGEWFFLSKTAAGALVFEVKDSSGVVRQVSTAAQSFAADTWVHIAVAWDFNGRAGTNQDSLQIFVNAGTPSISAFTSNGFISTQVGTLYAGDNPLGLADTLGSVNSANGLIDELQLFNYNLTQAQVNTAMGTTHACGSYVIDHLEIQHASGAGLTCAPSTVTLRACQNAACTTLYTGGLSGSFSATGTPTINWDGSTGNAAGAGFVIGPGSSSISKSFQITTAGSLVLGTTNLSPAAAAATSCNFGSPSCSFSAADSGFILSVPNHAAESSQTLTISAVRKSDNAPVCTPAFANVSKTVNLRCSYANPSSGTLPVRLAGQALNAGNNTAAACDAGGRDLSLAFNASGVASTSLLYADAGQLNLLARYSGASGSESGLVMNGSTSFVARPASFALSAIRCTSTGPGQCAQPAPGNNPAAASAGGAAFIAAGQSFSVTVTALNSLGTATPNYGRESSAEGVKLSAALVAPAGGNAPALSNASAFGVFSAGVATGTTFSWPEVGIITLTPSVADGDYLGAGDVVGSTSGNVGRFIPARFVVASPALTHRVAAACTPASGFSYLDENFQLGFTLSAQNLAGGTTQNYAGAFAKLDLAVPAGFGLAGIQGTTQFKTSNGRLALASSSGAWSAGVAANITLTAMALRAATPDGPFASAQFGIVPADSDGVTLTSFNLDTDSPANGNDRSLLATVPLRYGRLRLQNAIGSQDRGLALPLQAQYWNGTAFTLNTLDSCTRINATHLSFGNLRKTLTVADAALSTAGVTLAGGQSALPLVKPGAGRSGSMDVAISLDSSATDASCLQPWTPAKSASAGANMRYLRGAWCGASADRDPAARASFGLYRGHDSLIYQRENY